MKKTALISACLIASIGASAQTALVKEVERNLKAKPTDYPAQVQKLQPAFTNEETKDQAYPYFVAGKGGYDFFDNQQVFASAGQSVDQKAMGQALIDAYGYMLKALQNDTIVDPKGKVKTKYSKDIVKLINNHYNDFNNAAVYMWQAQDYNGAYDAWELAFAAPNEPILGANAPAILPDSIMNVYAFNQGLAAFNLKEWEKTLKCFDRSIALGNDTKQVYDYAIGAAYNLPEEQRIPLMSKYAQLAYPKYGTEDDSYIGYIINEKLKTGQFEDAEAIVKKSIAEAPGNAQLHYVLGVLYENKENDPEAEALALEQFRQCVELDNNHANGYLQLGYLTFRKGEKISDEASNLSAAEYNQKIETEVFPILREAAKYLERCYELNPEEGGGALANLRNIYYNLKDEENLNRIEKLQRGY